MLLKPSSVAFAMAALSSFDSALGREPWLERNGRPVTLRFTRRRFGQEHPAVIEKLAAACSGAVCGTLAGGAITPLLAAQPECSQQDFADKIIDQSLQFDTATQANMLQLAIEYRQAEKNVAPDFSTNPPKPRNSVFCQQAPKHAELNCLVQAQDPQADGTLFFDPATGKSVKAGEQRNTSPFCSNSTIPTANAAIATDTSTTTASNTATAPVAAGAGGIGDFGSCSVPKIEFGVGFDGRKESSFQPVDKKSYNHGSAQNIGIITQFICDTLTNSCKADQTAKDTCKKAQAAAAAQTPKLGVDADAFNAVFNIQTNFAAVQALDDQGKLFGNVAGASATTNVAAAATTEANAASTSPAVATVPASAGGSSIGDFGSCSIPKIEFGPGFDARKETAFQPADKTSYNHGSAQAIGIITQFICDTLTNSCKADQTAKDTCKNAQAAAAQPAKQGIDADAFNAVFGIQTNFAAVQTLDDKGAPVAGTAVGSTTGATTTDAAAATNAAAASSSTPTAASSSAASSGLGNFGTCTVPQLDFATGFDGRKESSFQPTDKTSYDHSSAQNGDIIAQFMCDTLVNKCGADQTARDNCAKARAAFNAATPVKSGKQADAFNAALGITTNLAAVPIVDNQGNVVQGA